MKNKSMFIGALIFLLIIWVFLGSCSPKYTCPTYSDNFICPIEEEIIVRYDTVIDNNGNVLLYKRRYKPTRFEKIGFVVFAGVAIYMIQESHEQNKDP